MARRTIIAGNWKMYKNRTDAISLVKDLLAAGALPKGREMAVFVPAVHAREVSALCIGRIDTGMQNMYFEKEGAFTGENSPLMVKDCGCRYILIGHSERRHVFGEKDDLLAKKVQSAIEHGLDPMLCVGELLAEREAGTSKDVCKKQLVEALKGLTREQIKNLVIAYEPVWAIGTGKVATNEQTEEMHASIRSVIEGLYGKECAESVPILYGGSVKADNAGGLLALPNVDGVLVGGASLKADSFVAIANA
jgi:triosephosphate isomerase (TIM)